MQQLSGQASRGDNVALKLRALNDRLMLAERGFLDADGLQGRHWHKHLVSEVSLPVVNISITGRPLK